MPILIFTIHRLQRHSFFLSWRSCTKTRHSRSKQTRRTGHPPLRFPLQRQPLQPGCRLFPSKDEPTKVRSIGRLDKETSGILLFARNQTAAARLQKQRENGISGEKTYLAAVSGSMLEDTDGTFHAITTPLAPDPDNRLKMVISPGSSLPGSKPAVTLYSVLKSTAPGSRISVIPNNAPPEKPAALIRSVSTWHLWGIRFWVIPCTIYRTQRIFFPGLPSTHGNLNFIHLFQLVKRLQASFLPFPALKMYKKEISLEAPVPEDFKKFYETMF